MIISTNSGNVYSIDSLKRVYHSDMNVVEYEMYKNNKRVYGKERLIISMTSTLNIWIDTYLQSMIYVDKRGIYDYNDSSIKYSCCNELKKYLFDICGVKKEEYLTSKYYDEFFKEKPFDLLSYEKTLDIWVNDGKEKYGKFDGFKLTDKYILCFSFEKDSITYETTAKNKMQFYDTTDDERFGINLRNSISIRDSAYELTVDLSKYNPYVNTF